MTDHDPQIDDDARRNRLVLHLARLTQRGGKVEEQDGFRAVVVVAKPKPSMVPNILMAIVGVALFLWTKDYLFILAALVAFAGWHRKLVAGIEKVRLLVRVDDSGRVSEMEMGTA